MNKKIPSATTRVKVRSIEFTFQDINNVVEAFYRHVEQDQVLSVPFRTVKDWPHHIERLTHFWWIRFGGQAYLPGFYNPVEKHFLAGFNEAFLARWLDLFRVTLARVLAEDQAQIWSMIADKMGGALLAQNQIYKEEIRSRSLSVSGD